MVRQKEILKLLGKFPKKTPLNLKIVGSADKGKYLMKTISYNVEKNERVKAYLLVPKDISKKTPGILALHQHACEFNLGKSETAGLGGKEMYAYGKELCLRGYIVLCPDNLCFEERQDKDLEGMWYERFIFMKYLLTGSTLQTKYISDISCALKVLKSLNGVDGKNIGVIGHSLGGQEALWSMWHNKEIRACVSSGGFSKMQDIIDKKINHSFSTYLPNFLKKNGMGDIISGISPRSLMIIAGKKDHIFPIKGVREIVKRAKKDKKSNLEVIYHNEGHVFPEEIRKKAYGWLDKQLGLIK